MLMTPTLRFSSGGVIDGGQPSPAGENYNLVGFVFARQEHRLP